MAFVMPGVVGALVLGAAVTGAVFVDTRMLGLPAPSFEVRSTQPLRQAMGSVVDRVELPFEEASATGLPTFPPGQVFPRAAPTAIPPAGPWQEWCSTTIPPLRRDSARGTELFLVEGTLVVRVPVEGGDAILRDAPGGYCMLFGPSPHLEVTTLGRWIVFTRDEPGGAGLYRMHVDGSAFERVASLASMPVALHGFDRHVSVDYVFAGIGGAGLIENGFQRGQLFEMLQEPGGVEVPGLGDAWDTKRAVSALTYQRPREYTDGDVARLRYHDGREKIVATRGTQVCTIVPIGSPMAMSRFSGWIYYVRDRVLWRVPVHGGVTQRVRRVPFQPDWLSIRWGDVTGRSDDDRSWQLTIADDSPEQADRKPGTTCDP